MSVTREELIEILKDDYCPLLWMQGDVANLADYLIANSVTVQQWVPAAERMPDLKDDQWVDEDGSTGSFQISDWVWGINTEGIQARVRYETGPIFQGWYEEDGKTHNITYWMPLPEAPKQKSVL